MAASIFWYDLETSGINPSESRIMQFAGQRTDLSLRNIGDPVNVLIKITDDVLPDPEAVLLTGITPQMTIQEGISEAEFLIMFSETVALPGTIFTGFNSIHFDDEFMRYVHYRNFYDPYQWQWQDNRSRWDLLDLARLTRALRPEGINWPTDTSGKSTNRLEHLAAKNKLDHANAHDALSDVQACIELARLIRTKQPRLFDYSLMMRDKRRVEELVRTGKPFVYCSGSYSSEHDKTTIVCEVGEGLVGGSSLVYDLRVDPRLYQDMSAIELADAWAYKPERSGPRFPVKSLRYNRCPAIAPLSVVDDDARQRLGLDMDLINKHYKRLMSATEFSSRLTEAATLKASAQLSAFTDEPDVVDRRLYERFYSNPDKQLMAVVRAAEPSELDNLELPFEDDRLKALLPLYKARNYPKLLSIEERTQWDNFRKDRLLGGGQHSRMAHYFNRLQILSSSERLTAKKEYLLEELRLYGESIMPEIDEF